MGDLASQLVALRQQAERTLQLRTRAETTVEHVKQQLASVDAQLRELGVDPDTAEVQLKQMEDVLQAKLAELAQALQAEEKACQDVLLAAQAAQQ